ncbi:MAG: 16S rRNA processing protein RimM [Actinobacteria bacterium]|nr:16S rRNA processing protein RimM [Actinomycetota bacterium]
MDAGDRSLLEVGRIVKAHGIRGEVAVRLTADIPERVTPGSVFQTTRGPLTIERSKPFQQGYIIAFAGIADRNEAELLRGLLLKAEPLDLDDDDVIWIDDLFNAVVVSTDGIERGRVIEVEENPASDLLVLDSGALIPLTFVVEVEPNERIVVEAPEGLFE